MKLTLACDHRTVDGVTGAQFLQTLREYIEQPLRWSFNTMQSPKRVIVTGASRGIGRALVDRFLDLGHEVWALSRNTDELNKIKGIHTVSIDFLKNNK